MIGNLEIVANINSQADDCNYIIMDSNLQFDSSPSHFFSQKKWRSHTFEPQSATKSSRSATTVDNSQAPFYQSSDYIEVEQEDLRAAVKVAERAVYHNYKALQELKAKIDNAKSTTLIQKVPFDEPCGRTELQELEQLLQSIKFEGEFDKNEKSYSELLGNLERQADEETEIFEEEMTSQLQETQEFHRRPSIRVKIVEKGLKKALNILRLFFRKVTETNQK